jgi:choline dehydrogenase
MKTRPDIVAPDIQVHFVMLIYGENGVKLHDSHGFQPLINVQRPESIGTVMITSSDPTVAPAIDPNYLAASADVRVLRDGIKLCREVIAQKAFDPYRGVEINPGLEVKTDREIDEYVRQSSHTQFHPVGTCKMGNDSLAVVDSSLKLRGLEGLRVIDASVMPSMVSANTNAAVIMIAEKGADMILGRQAPAPAHAH